MKESSTPNRLAQETSPYLRQHANNPVDWYPWSSEAFATAKAESKLVLLSVGYSACHWCHVMAHESFEDEEIAALMNQHYVCIKVDREERPDVDHIYMQVVQAMTGHGGWPMTVFMNADGVPLFGGTYFPPTDRPGMPGFVRILKSVAEVYERRGAELLDSGKTLLEALSREEEPKASDELLTKDLLDTAFASLSRMFDDRFGGMDRAPKFPQPMTWELVLRHWWRTRSERAETMVRTTLTKMARGGMYDQIGGGFHRYSVDGQWLVPHFEKMLYDNAQLARLYTDAYRAFGNEEYRRIAEETLGYLLREMRDPAGGFYSAQDADSEGEEGRFFLWTREETERVLGSDKQARAAFAYWGLSGRPNFEGEYILSVPRDSEVVARELEMSLAELRALVVDARQALFEHREHRIKPGRDDKVLTAWNGLTLRAFAEAGVGLQRPDYLEAARQNAEFLLSQMRRADGRVLRTWMQGEARLLAYLEDYGALIDGLVALHAATFERRWLAAAVELADSMLELFWDEASGGFYDTGRDHEALVVRPRDTFDNATPCGSSLAADALLRLWHLTGTARYQERATATLRSAAPLMRRYPSGGGRFLGALDFHLGPVAEVVLVWPDNTGPDPFVRTIFAPYLPNMVVTGSAQSGVAEGGVLLAERTARHGQPTAYLCEGQVCQAPTTDPAELGQQIDALRALAS